MNSYLTINSNSLNINVQFYSKLKIEFIKNDYSSEKGRMHLLTNQNVFVKQTQDRLGYKSGMKKKLNETAGLKAGIMDKVYWKVERPILFPKHLQKMPMKGEF